MGAMIQQCRNERIEQFDAYRAIGRGVPFLWIHKRKNTASVCWGDGTLWDYGQFRNVLDSEAMERDLLALWATVPKTRRRAEFSRGGVHGGLYCVPPQVAEDAYTIVLDYFNKALPALLKEPRR